jgi:hypothetical protein
MLAIANHYGTLLKLRECERNGRCKIIFLVIFTPNIYNKQGLSSTTTKFCNVVFEVKEGDYKKERHHQLTYLI